MPVPVPKEDKVYTTVYDNFKGVDFTNDASNVFRRRSPNGKNMLPDLDGRPYKRKGWKIDIPAEDFMTAAGYVGSGFTTKRIHHFSMGAQDYMMIFTTIGVFWMSKNSPTLHKCVLATKDLQGNIITSPFPPAVDGIHIDPDPGRSFFFEGQGVAGFYIFVGTDLYRFGADEYCWAVEPYVPKVLIACDQYGAGTNLEPVNLLTRKRTVQYLCDGETTQFGIPFGAKDNQAKVELLGADGEWTQTSGYTINGGIITFNTAPPVVIQGEDNMRITYSPAGGYVTKEVQEEIEPNTVTTTVKSPTEASGVSTHEQTSTRERTVRVRFIVSGRNVTLTRVYGDWKNSSFTGRFSPATITLTNAVSGENVSITPAGGFRRDSAYSDRIVYQPPTEAYNSVTPTIATSKSVVWDSVSDQDALKANRVSVTAKGKLTYAEITGKEIEKIVRTYSVTCTASYEEYSTFSSTSYKTRTVTKIEYVEGDGEFVTNDARAFTACQRSFVYGSGMYNQAFLSASSLAGYNSRVWYSMADDPTYFPDTNYIEAGGDDTHIKGMMKVSGYVGIIKQGSAMDASVYLAYPTSFEQDTTFAVTQSINGVGALADGAFNILNAEPLFLSSEGVMGIEVSEEEVDRKIRSRSYFINKRLCAENRLDDAVSFVFKGLYYLCVNDHCYVLDGAQKTSWANEKTNLQYECYFLDNIPAQCFSAMGNNLYFMDTKGNLCRFKTDSDANPYRDEYSVDLPDATANTAPVSNVYQKIALTGDFELGSTIQYGDLWYTVIDESENTVTVTEGVPIDAVWDTIADDDGAVHFFKNLQKKGCLVSILPGSASGVKVSLKADEKEPAYIGKVDKDGNLLPFEYYTKKKIKKYKRLQIICENDAIDESFGIDQIIKSYTIGNYSKNRG